MHTYTLILMQLGSSCANAELGSAQQQSPAGQRRRGNGFQESPLHVRTLVFSSARHGSKNPGFVLRPLSCCAIASFGVAYSRRPGPPGARGAF